MIQIYKKGNTDFVYNGESVLMPEKCTLNAKLNDAWEMTLIHPLDEGERWKHIKEEAVICAPTFMGEEQLFRIYDVEKTEEEVIAKARPIFFDSAKDCFLMDVRPDGKNGQQALNIMMAGSKYKGESDITTGSTAYFVRRNLMDALNGEDSPTFVQRWGGEILYDNYKVIINERAGSDRGTEVRYGKNIKGASYHVDMSEVVTRIIPIAYNGRGMSGKEPWVDSTEISKYATVYTKEMKFDNIKLKSDASGENEGDIICKNQTELDARLTAACRKQYEAGVDKPKISINISLADLKGTEEYKEFERLETIGLGDTVHCHHQVLDITTEARAIEIEWDCIQNVCSSVALGEYEYDYFSELTSTLEAVNKVLGPKNTIMAERISGVLNAINTQLRYQKNIAQKQDVRAILFEDVDPTSPSYGAMCLGTQGFQIADKRLQDDSDWDWTTAFTAKGGYASVFITGILSDKTGKNFWNLDTGEFQLSSTQTIVDGQPLGSYLEGVKAFAIRLSNDFQSIPTDYLGNYKVFPEVSTIVYVNFGKDDISSQCTYKVTQSKGVTGNWDNEKRMYTMTGLTEDSGYVDIEATYLGTFKVTKRFNVNKQKSGQPGEQGETGRTYFIELSANILKRRQNNRILPISVSAKAFYRDGTSAARTAYAGRWKVETSTNGVDYTTVVSSTANESSKSYRVETLAANIVSVRFTLYAAGGLTTPLDMQSIPIVIDVDNLTHEQIFNLLTNNGAMKGIYQSGGQLYVNGTYIRSLIITADMIQGKELASLGATLGGFIVESKRIRNTSSDEKKAMYIGSYDWNNSDCVVIQNNVDGAWKNLLMLKYDGSLESRNYKQNERAKLNSGGLEFTGFGRMLFTSDGLSNGNRCKISVNAPHAEDLSDGSSPGWSENILGDTHVDGELRVYTLRVNGGLKQIVKQTEHYGEASFYCDETPTPLLSDYGEGTIASDGLCYVDIDDIFREAVNSNIQYFVFLQKEGPGDCWVKERANTHFVVQGTPGLNFTWAIKIKQKGTEHLRFSEEEQNLRIHSLSPETVMEAEQEETTQQENETMEQYTNWMFRTMKEMEERYNEEIDIIYES